MVELDVNKWAEQQFGNCQLGDQRRTRRAVKFAAQVAADPSGSTPEQTEKWSDCKAAYHLLDREETTFAALAGPHWGRTKGTFQGHILLIDDTTDVCFGQRSIAGMGMINDQHHPGFLLHSSLAVQADSGEVLGLAGQTIRHRRRCQKQHSRQRIKRADRESRIWGDVIDLVGPPAEGVLLTHVCDRGADNFEVYCHLVQQRSAWVIRAAQNDRLILTPQGEKQRLDDYLDTLSPAGSYALELRATAQRSGRTARLEVRFGPLSMPRPHDTSAWVKESGIRQIAMHVVEVREVDAPHGVEPLHWILYTAHGVTCFEEARRVIEYYQMRPIIEDYHKALKTGCRVESRLYETAARLEAVTGVLSVVAVRLLQLKTVAHVEPARPAAQVVPAPWLAMMNHLPRHRRRPLTTVSEFYRALAMLGGFLGRKSDGQPGWLTLWRGFEKLHLMIRGAETLRGKCG
jgi:hypothetical protein